MEKKEYFLWKHNLSVLREVPLTEEELCNKIKSKSLAYMKNGKNRGISQFSEYND